MMDLTVSSAECLKSMASVDEAAFEKAQGKDWHRSHGTQLVTVDLLERTLYASTDILFDLIEIKDHISVSLEDNLDSSKTLARRMENATEIERFTAKAIMVLEYVLHVLHKIGAKDAKCVLPVLDKILQVAGGSANVAKVAMEPPHVLVRQIR